MTVRELDTKRFEGKWYGIEHNVHNTKVRCVRTGMNFIGGLGGGPNGTLIRSCKLPDGTETQDVKQVRINTGEKVSMVLISPALRIGSYEGLKSEEVIDILDIDYDNYVITGRGKLFHIYYRKEQIEYHVLVEIERILTNLGYDVSDTIKNENAIIPCNCAAVQGTSKNEEAEETEAEGTEAEEPQPVVAPQTEQPVVFGRGQLGRLGGFGRGQLGGFGRGGQLGGFGRGRGA